MALVLAPGRIRRGHRLPAARRERHRAVHALQASTTSTPKCLSSCGRGQPENQRAGVDVTRRATRAQALSLKQASRDDPGGSWNYGSSPGVTFDRQRPPDTSTQALSDDRHGERAACRPNSPDATGDQHENRVRLASALIERGVVHRHGFQHPWVRDGITDELRPGNPGGKSWRRRRRVC